MSVIEIDPIASRDASAPALGATTTRSASSSPAAASTSTAIKAKVAAFARRGALLGRRHRRHPLRALPRAGRAEQHPREARGLRRHPAAAGATPTVSLHFPWDKVRHRGRCAEGGGARPRLRRGELQHLLGPPGQPHTYKFGSLATPTPRSAPRRSSTTSNASRSAGARLQGADRLGRRRHQLPRPEDFTRAFDRYLDAMREIYAALPDDWRICWSTRCTSRRSIRR